MTPRCLSRLRSILPSSRAARALGGLALAAIATLSAMAAGEHERRLGAEIAVMLGDIRRLAQPADAPERAGLELRLKGALAGLPLLIRRARDSNPTPPLASEAIAVLREAIPAQDWARARSALAQLATAYPFDARPLLSAEPTPERIAVGKAIHAEACAGCHDVSSPDSLLPSHNLSQWARAMPAEEFAARLVAGIRGDALTGLANPFGAAELAALFAFYRSAAAN